MSRRESRSGLFALMVSPFQFFFPTLFPLLFDNKSDFLPLRLLVVFQWGKHRHFFSSLSALSSPQTSKIMDPTQIWSERADHFDKNVIMMMRAGNGNMTVISRLTVIQMSLMEIIKI